MSSNLLKYLFEIICVAILYIVTAKVGQQFAIPPGNITPVWLPSGIMVALVIIRGYGIWPGIFIGAFIGNVSAYIDFDSVNLILSAFASASFNGLGDTLGIVGSVYFFNKFSREPTNTFFNLASFWRFVMLCAFLGAGISALFGVTGLALFGYIDSASYATSLLTWWTGDSVGVLLITPLVLIFYNQFDEINLRDKITELSLFLMTFISLSYLIATQPELPEFLPDPIFLILPVLLWSILRLGFRVTFLSSFIIFSISILITSQQQGPFYGGTQLLSLLEFQLYLILIITSIFTVGILNAERNTLFLDLQLQYDHDPLTGASTRPCFIKAIDMEVQRFKRYGAYFSLIMFDIDHFKVVNDTYGHHKGDEILKTLVVLLQEELRDIDTLSRWGGEEFLILLPHTSASGAHQFAERCREKIKCHHFNIDKNVTISLGIIESKPGVSFTDMLNNADSAMYQSKNNGRNQSTIFNNDNIIS